MLTDLKTRPRPVMAPVIRRNEFYTALQAAADSDEGLTPQTALDAYMATIDRNSYRHGTMCSHDDCTLLCVWDGEPSVHPLGLGRRQLCPEHGAQPENGPLLVAFYRDDINIPDNNEFPRSKVTR